MRGTRAKKIRRAVHALHLSSKYVAKESVVKQIQADGTIKRFITNLAEAIKKPKAFAVTGQIVCPSALAYRAAKRAWVRRGK